MINSFLSKGIPETEKEYKNVLISTVMNLNDIKYFEQELQDFYQTILKHLTTYSE